MEPSMGKSYSVGVSGPKYTVLLKSTQVAIKGTTQYSVEVSQQGSIGRQTPDAQQ